MQNWTLDCKLRYTKNMLKCIFYTALLFNVLYTVLYTNIKVVSLLPEDHVQCIEHYNLYYTEHQVNYKLLSVPFYLGEKYRVDYKVQCNTPYIVHYNVHQQIGEFYLEKKPINHQFGRLCTVNCIIQYSASVQFIVQYIVKISEHYFVQYSTKCNTLKSCQGGQLS